MSRGKLIKPYIVKLTAQTQQGYYKEKSWSSLELSDDSTLTLWSTFRQMPQSNPTSIYSTMPALSKWPEGMQYDTSIYDYYLWEKSYGEPSASELTYWGSGSRWGYTSEPASYNIFSQDLYYISKNTQPGEGSIYKYNLTGEYKENYFSKRDLDDSSQNLNNCLIPFHYCFLNYANFNPLLSPCIIYNGNNGFYTDIFSSPESVLYIGNTNYAYNSTTMKNFREEKMNSLQSSTVLISYCSDDYQGTTNTKTITYSAKGNIGDLVKNDNTNYTGTLCKEEEGIVDNVPIKVGQDNIVFFPSSGSSYLNTVVNGTHISNISFSFDNDNDWNCIFHYTLNPAIEDVNNLYLVFKFIDSHWREADESQGFDVTYDILPYGHELTHWIENIGNIESCHLTESTVRFRFKETPPTNYNSGFYLSIEQWKNGTIYD